MYSTDRPKICSFLFGLLVVLPGFHALDRQILLETDEKRQRGLTRFFAMGHMIVSYSVILVIGLTMYAAMGGKIF